MVGTQEADAAGDLARLAEPADGDLRDDLFQHRFGHGGDHVGVDIARGDGVDGDAETRAFLRQRLGEAVDAALRRGIIDLAILARLPVDRTDVDDPAPAAFLHARKGRLGEIETAAQIGPHHGVPVFVAHLQQRAVAGDAGIVDDDVDRAVFFCHLAAGILHRVEIADVELDRRNAGFIGEFARRIVIARIIGDDGEFALVAQAFADGAADSARAPGNDGHTCHDLSPKLSVALPRLKRGMHDAPSPFAQTGEDADVFSGSA